MKMAVVRFSPFHKCIIVGVMDGDGSGTVWRQQAMATGLHRGRVTSCTTSLAERERVWFERDVGSVS